MVLTEELVDLALVDVIIPGMTGLSLFKQIRDSYPEIAIVFVTSIDDMNLALDSIKKGAYDYIIKSTIPHKLVEGAELGGEADKIGKICSDYAHTVTQLRAKLYLASFTFSFLTIPMHATTTFILVFVLNIIVGFNRRLGSVDLGTATASTKDVLADSSTAAPVSGIADSSGLTGNISIFQHQDMSTVTAIILLVIVILTIANSLAPKFAGGGSNLKIASYLSIMCLISGFVLGVVPAVTARIFS